MFDSYTADQASEEEPNFDFLLETKEERDEDFSGPSHDNYGNPYPDEDR